MFGWPSRPWALHNPLKSWTLAGLSLRECQLLVASMSDAETKITWVYHKDWNEWKSLSDEGCHSLFRYQDKAHAALPPIPEMPGDERDHDVTQVRSLEEMQAAKAETSTRRHERRVGRVPVEIMVGPHRFATHTKDLSGGGFLFEDPLPEWVAGYFTVALKADTDYFELTCVLAEDQKKDKFRAEIAPITSDAVIALFQRWLDAQNFPKLLPK